MSRVLFLGNSSRQLESLPTAAKRELEWAMEELERDPSGLPTDPVRGIETKALTGPIPLFRIALRRDRTDPGYRLVHALVEDEVWVVRVVRRDAATYSALKRALRSVRLRRR